MYVVRRGQFCELSVDTLQNVFSISMRVLRPGKRLLYEPTVIADANSTELVIDGFCWWVRNGAWVTLVICRELMLDGAQLGRLILFVSHKMLRRISRWLVLGMAFAAILALLPRLVIAISGMAGTMWRALRRHWGGTASFHFLISQVALTWGTAHRLLFESSSIWSRATYHLDCLEHA